MTNYKTLCAELLAVFDNYDDESNLVGIFDDMKANKIDLLDRARAALAAEPEPPANGEVEVVLEATPAEPFSGSGLSGLITCQIGYARVGSGTPTDFRWGRRNGALVLQVGCAWRQGAEHGVDWKDVPTVDLDNEAQP